MKNPQKKGFFAFVTAQDKISFSAVVAAFLSIRSVFMVVYFLVTANNGTPVAIAHRLLFVLFIMILGVFTYPLKRKNLTEWQCGMASIKPRWNVSGTYMQVLPRFVSTKQDGSDEREFFSGSFPGPCRHAVQDLFKGLSMAF